jgi:hypothetical protein
MPVDYNRHECLDGEITVDDDALLRTEWPLQEAKALVELLLQAWPTRDELRPQTMYEALLMLDNALGRRWATSEPFASRSGSWLSGGPADGYGNPASDLMTTEPSHTAWLLLSLWLADASNPMTDERSLQCTSVD